MPDCTRCDTMIQSGSLCDICARERNHAHGDHDTDGEPDCGRCGGDAAAGGYSDGRAGLWLCVDCLAVERRQSQRVAIAQQSTDALAGAVRWAVGDDDAYPEQDPAALEAGFETASTLRAVADGGPDLQEWALDLIHEQVADEAKEPQDDSLWTSKGRLKAEASKVDFVERDEVAGLVDALEARGDVVYWHGLIAPTDPDHISEIVGAENQADHPRSLLLGRVSKAKQNAEQELVADGGELRCGYCDSPDLAYELESDKGRVVRCIPCLAIEQGQQQLTLPFDVWIDRDDIEPYESEDAPDFEPFDPTEHDYKTARAWFQVLARLVEDDPLVKRDPDAHGTIFEGTREFLINIMGEEAHYPPSEVAGNPVHPGQATFDGGDA